MLVIAFFSVNGTPETSLTPLCSITRATDGAQVVSGAAMTHIGHGFYEYDFSDHSRAYTYVVICDGGSSLPSEQRYATTIVSADTISNSVDAIKAKTDGLPASTQTRFDQVDAAIAEIPDSSAMAVMLNDVEAGIRGGSETLETLSGRVQASAIAIDAILAIESGTWEIIGTQMVFKAPGTNVEIARFNLYDIDGNPSASSVYKRVRI